MKCCSEGGFASRQFAQLRAQRGNFIGQTLDLRRARNRPLLILRVATDKNDASASVT